MIAETILVVWVLVALATAGDVPAIAVFGDEASCRAVQAKVEAVFSASDGIGQSDCVSIKVERVKKGPTT